VPTTLVVKASSTGGSKLTSPAQCTTASRSPGSGGTSARSPSTTPSREASSASTPPASATVCAKTGFSSSLAIRAAPPVEPLGRTRRLTRTSGTSCSSRCSSASPTKPVTPVSSRCRPASLPATDPDGACVMRPPRRGLRTRTRSTVQTYGAAREGAQAGQVAQVTSPPRTTTSRTTSSVPGA